jgi:probable O-glycosylation ligase (exosortase A-associated)
VHLATSERNPIFHRPLKVMVPLTMIAVMMTGSRGGALAMALSVMVLVWRSRSRLMGLVIAGLAGLMLLGFAPDSYKDRIRSIRDYEDDGSAVGRLMAWKIAGNMIRANPVFGVGFDRFKSNYNMYDPNRPRDAVGNEGARVAHNSYLQIWAECGTPAFLVYMVMLALTVIDLWGIRRRARRRYHASWILSYATMFEASIAAFLVGSMFLNRAQFDLIYHYVAIVLVFGRIARQEMADEVRYPVRSTASFGGVTTARNFGRKATAGTGFRDTPLLGAGG